VVRRCPRRSLPTHRSPRPSGTARRCFGRSATHAEWHARLSIPTAGIDYWLHGADALPHRGHAAIVHSAFGCSALCDQCLHRGPAAGLRLGHRGTRTYPCQVPGPEACRDVQHRRELAGACFLGHRDDQHRGGAAELASSRARDAEGGAGAAEGDRAATVLCAWSHPGRIHSEAAFAMLAGVASIPANSGQVTTRYRLNRHGDRQLNNALHTVVQSRIQYRPCDARLRRSPHGRRQDRPRDQTLPGCDVRGGCPALRR